MQKSELFEIIANGENSGIEFKRDDIRPEDLAKEIVAMLNFQGGRVLLGVEDDGEISGIKRENLEEWVMNVVRDKIHPTVLPYFEKIKIDDNHFVAVITFPIGNSKPYVRRHSGKEEIFIRVGSTSRTATREEQMRLFELGGMLHTELLPVPRTNIESLDLARIENYLKDIIKDPDVPETKPEWKERLKGLGFITENNGNLYCTIAGLILFGKNPRKYLKQSGIRLFVFNSNNKEYKAVLDTIIDAPLVARWNITETERTLIDDGLIERFIEIISSYINEEGNSIDENFRRELNWIYPAEAIREVFLNALAHRDWTRFLEIEVGIYKDRLEIISPGALPNSMTIEKMLAGQRSPRNPLIMEVLRDYRYVDYRGMGIRTKIVPLIKNKKNIVFEATEDYLKTVFYII